VKEFLRQHNTTFEEVSVEDRADAWDRIREHTGGPIGTPAVIIDGEARIGFDPEWMARKLGLEGAGA